MKKHLLTTAALLLCLTHCAHKEGKKEQSHKSSPASQSSAVMVPHNPSPESSEESKANLSRINLDEKSRVKVDDAFRAVVRNDDKKAKAAYGRSYKFMPEFVQFAFDLRFKNFDHGAQLMEKLPYEASEKEFWQALLKSKPKSISKAVCEELKKKNFEISKEGTLPGALNEELNWFRELQEVVDQSYKEELGKAKSMKTSEINEILASIPYKDTNGAVLPLKDDVKKKIFSDSFFDKMRNAQRRDTRYWTENFQSPLKVWTYQRGFIPAYAFDLYSSMAITEDPKLNHFMKRIKGIIKDMRVENSLFRQRGDALIQDEEDLKKATAVSHFMNRYLIISTFMNLDPALASCGLH